jgi:hypothetical protein
VKRWRLVLAALLGAAAVAHVAYWYLPRARAGTPELDRIRTLLADHSWDVVLWIPFPHQNLSALETRVGDAEAWLAHLAEVGGRRPMPLPKFGPWSAPPAREMAIAADEAGGLLAVARVYPTIAGLARFAGRIAGNPWLAGGLVPLGGGSEGSVDWDGRVWTLRVERGGAGGGDGGRVEPGVASESEPALARVWLRRPPAPLPPGVWVLRRDAAGRLLASTGETGEPLPSGPSAAGGEPPAAWLAAASAEPPGGFAAMMLWTAGGPIEGLPRAATLARVGSRGFELPGAPIARLAGLDPGERIVDGVLVRAFDDTSLAEASAIVPWLRRAVAGSPGEAPRRTFAAGADPGRAATALRRAAEHLSKIPILGTREARRLEAAAGLLAPWEGCGDLRVEVWDDPPGARAVLCSRDASGAAGTPAR